MKIDFSFHVTGDMLDNPKEAIAVVERALVHLKLENKPIEVGQKFDLRDASGHIVGTYAVRSEATNPTEDQFMTALQLRDKYRRKGHPEHTVADWLDAVKDTGTHLGYWDWLVHMLDDGEGD